MFFIENHGDESMGRCKMRLRILFLVLWMLFLAFPHTLGGVRNKILEFGSQWTKFGRACIDQTQNLRKSMKSTCVMNKSLFWVFINEIIPYNTHNIHIKPSPKIWFETEHFQNLGFSNPGLRVPPVTSWARNGFTEKFSWILEI